MTSPEAMKVETRAWEHVLTGVVRQLHDKPGRSSLALGDYEPLVRLSDAQALSTQVQRLTEENEGLRRERDEADNALVDKYRDPKTGNFCFPSDVAAIVRRLDTAEARIKALDEAQAAGVEHIETLSELLKIIKEHWIDYDHVFSIAVHEADQFAAARALSTESQSK